MNTTFDAGINVFEAARTYGTIEDQVAWFIKQRPRDKMYISSKTHMRNKDGVLRSIDISLAHLKTDYIEQKVHHHTRKKFDTYFPSWTTFRKGVLGEQEI